MPRYLSPEWVESFDAALGALDLSDAVAAAGAGSLAAADGTLQRGPGGHRRARRRAGGGAGTCTSSSPWPRAGPASALDPAGTAGGTATIVLGYAEALAMARGELDPADALAAGRVRVRGDLAALVAGQDVLAEAAARLGTDLEELTDPPAPAP